MSNIRQYLKEHIELMTPLVKPLGDKVQDSIHMTSGAITELFLELQEAFDKQDMINIVEEFGDAFFYLSQLAVIHGTVDAFIEGYVSLDTIPVSNDEKITYGLLSLLRITDMNKGCQVYGREYDPLLMASESYELGRQFSIAIREELGDQNYESTIGVLEKNYEKLHKVRYKDGYSDYSANNRDLDAEREALGN